MVFQFYGAGYVQGLDGRNETANKVGTGGYLQLASYVAGLSGGSWTVGSLAMNDWPTVQNLHDNVWGLQYGVLNPPTPGNANYQQQLVEDVRGRLSSGAAISLADLYGRNLTAHFYNSSYPNYGRTAQWTDIRKTSSFANAQYPFPMVTTLTSNNGKDFGAGGNGTVVELTPYEVGNYEDIQGFVPTELLGTQLNNGQTQLGNNQCVYGLSNAGYIIALSSSIWNSIALPQTIAAVLVQVISQVAGSITQQITNPVGQIFNPFKGYKNNPTAAWNNVSFVDGGEDGQTVPLAPLLQPARALDFIIALDSNTDTKTSWSGGYSLFATYQRYSRNANLFGKVPMPKIPSVTVMIDQGLNTRPVFFGCNSQTDVINPGAGVAPVIAFVANYPWTYLSNVSTTQTQFDQTVSQSLLDNGFAAATLGGAPNWPTCLACASLQRSFERSKTPRPAVCNSCMDLYCWNGNTVTTATPSNSNYAPNVGTPAWVTQNAASVSRNAASSSAPSSSHLAAIALLSAVAISLPSLLF